MSEPTVPLDPTPIHVSDTVLDDLKARLRLTRLPLDAGNDDGGRRLGRRVTGRKPLR
jgi:hypothetical protein